MQLKTRYSKARSRQLSGANPNLEHLGWSPDPSSPYVMSPEKNNAVIIAGLLNIMCVFDILNWTLWLQLECGFMI